VVVRRLPHAARFVRRGKPRTLGAINGNAIERKEEGVRLRVHRGVRAFRNGRYCYSPGLGPALLCPRVFVWLGISGLRSRSRWGRHVWLRPLRFLGRRPAGALQVTLAPNNALLTDAFCLAALRMRRGKPRTLARMHDSRCPKCRAPTRIEEIGDMVTYTCTSCNWEEICMVARVFPDMPRAVNRDVWVRSQGHMPAAALHTLRSISTSVKSIPLNLLQEQLRSRDGVPLGLQAEYRTREIRAALEPLGFEVVCVVVDDAG